MVVFSLYKIYTSYLIPFFFYFDNQKNLLHICNNIKRYSNTLFHLLKNRKILILKYFQ